MKKVLKLLVFVLTIFIGTFEVNAATAYIYHSANDGCLGEGLGCVYGVNDGEQRSTGGYKIWLNSSETPAFCAEPGTTLISGNAISGSLLDYFKNGLSTTKAQELTTKINEYLYFGYGSSGRNTIRYYFATQKLIWEEIAASGFYVTNYYKSNVSDDENVKKFDFYATEITPHILDLTAEMNAIKSSITNYKKQPSICGSTTELTKGSSMTLTDSNGVLANYTVTAGNGVTAQASGNKLTVSSSTGTDMTVTLTKAKVGSDALIYTPDNTSASYQRVISGGSMAAVTCKLTFTQKTTVVKISKQDATTGKELKGAKLVLKDSNSKTVDSWTSGTTPHEIENLAPGEYTLIETSAPSGYKLNTETVKFTVSSDGTVATPVVMKNYPTKVKISKQDATTGKELKGAKLVLKDSNGKTVDSWTSGTTPHEIENLAPGKYTLTETLAPKGYVLSKEEVKFTVKTDGSVDGSTVMKNKPEEIPYNPPTGNIISAVSFFVGLVCLGYAVNYFVGMKKNEEK